MKLLRSANVRSLGFKRTYASSSNSLPNPRHEAIIKDLMSRQPTTIYDYLTPTPSHLLNIALADFLPPSCYPNGFRPDVGSFEVPKGSPTFLPQGHHMVYFPPEFLEKDLLPDGTDTQHSPGGLFVRRLWAGGSLKFSDDTPMQTSPAHHIPCREEITDVQIKGPETSEKVWVEVTRTIGSRRRPSGYPETFLVREKRKLVFMTAKPEELSQSSREKGIAAPKDCDFSVSLTPTPSLLFRFSALTFNAHRIHLDPTYCREVEGYRGMLVHGPLTLVLMLSVIRSQLGHRQLVSQFDYKNFAPLYAGEEMKICVSKPEGTLGLDKQRQLKVWIEDRDGAMAVKGIAMIGTCSKAPKEEEGLSTFLL